MIDNCNMLYMAKVDEAEAILFYKKLEQKMPVEHEKYIEILNKIAKQEGEHFMELDIISEEMKCKDPSPIDEIHILAEMIKEKINRVEKIAKEIKNEKIHLLSEEIEHKASEIESIAI